MWYAQNSHWIQNSIFFNRKFNSQFIIIDKDLKFKEIKYPIDYVNFEI